MNNSNRTKSLSLKWVKNEIIVVHTIITIVFELLQFHFKTKNQNLYSTQLDSTWLDLTRFDSLNLTWLDWIQLLKIALFLNYRVLTVHQWLECRSAFCRMNKGAAHYILVQECQKLSFWLSYLRVMSHGKK